MTLIKVKNKLSNVFQLLERTDLSATGEADNSIAEQVDLDLATIYPVEAGVNVTPHLAYLFNTRLGWFQAGTSFTSSDCFLSSPVNGFYRNNVYLTEKFGRLNGSLSIIGGSCEYKEQYHNHKYNYEKLYENIERDLGRSTLLEIKLINNDNTTSLTQRGYSSDFNSNNKNIFKQVYASSIVKNNEGYIHNLDGITVAVNPLRTMNTNTKTVIGASNEYIDLTGIMTIMIYNTKLVYIRYDGTRFNYKIFSYPNLSLISSGVETSIRNIYIKNNITRLGIIGPTGISLRISDYESISSTINTNGFICKIHGKSSYNAIKPSYTHEVIDLYNIIGPLTLNISDKFFIQGADKYRDRFYIHYL